ncbi:pilin [Delftia tsuruhatensis]|uniref:pilin n=1 Tax=Delftia TaxID=80865 RepID=UPI0030D12888
MAKGFTLIELMIVLAIFGVLAAIALPNYQNYASRARVTEALNLMAGAKISVTEYRLSRNSWPSNNTDVGLAQPTSIKGSSVQSVQVNGSVITAIMRSLAVPGGGVVVLKGSNTGDSMTWRCNPSVGTTIQTIFLPSECRQ